MSRNKEHRGAAFGGAPNGAAAFGGRPIGAPPKATPVFLIILYYEYLWVFLIHSLYIFHTYFLDMFHVFSLVCFLIYGVKNRSGHDRSQSFGSILHVSDPKMVF